MAPACTTSRFKRIAKDICRAKGLPASIRLKFREPSRRDACRPAMVSPSQLSFVHLRALFSCVLEDQYLTMPIYQYWYRRMSKYFGCQRRKHYWRPNYLRPNPKCRFLSSEPVFGWFFNFPYIAGFIKRKANKPEFSILIKRNAVHYLRRDGLLARKTFQSNRGPIFSGRPNLRPHPCGFTRITRDGSKKDVPNQ